MKPLSNIALQDFLGNLSFLAAVIVGRHISFPKHWSCFTMSTSFGRRRIVWTTVICMWRNWTRCCKNLRRNWIMSHWQLFRGDTSMFDGNFIKHFCQLQQKGEKEQAKERFLHLIMAERSEAMVLRKTGGSQNVVLLRTLKRTRLASASLNLGL